MSTSSIGSRGGSAMSVSPDAVAAAGEIVESLKSQMPTPGVDLLVVFASPAHRDSLEKIHAEVSAALSPRVALAVVADGIIGRGVEAEEGPAVSALALSIPGAIFRPFAMERAVWAEAIEAPDVLNEHIHVGGEALRAITLIADPYTTPVARGLPLFNDVFPDLPVVGGMARPQEAGLAKMMVGDKLWREGAIGLAIGGKVRAHTTVSQGCRPIGRHMVITKSHRHVLQALGGRAALTVLSEMLETLPEADRDLVKSHGLWVGRVTNEYKEQFGRGDFLIRPIVGFDQQSGALGVGDPHIRVGQTVQFHVRDAATAEEDLRLLLESQAALGPAAGALLFTCNGRGSRLFGRPSADASMIRDGMGDPPLAGFFAAGEIGPIAGQVQLHGHTASMLVLRPENGGA